jgi:hypothetical protein
MEARTQCKLQNQWRYRRHISPALEPANRRNPVIGGYERVVGASNDFLLAVTVGYLYF